MVGTQDRGRDRLLHRSRRCVGAGDDAALECPDPRAVQRPVGNVRPSPGPVDPFAHPAAGREPLAPRRRMAPRKVAAALRVAPPSHDAGEPPTLQTAVGPALTLAGIHPSPAKALDT